MYQFCCANDLSTNLCIGFLRVEEEKNKENNYMFEDEEVCIRPYSIFMFDRHPRLGLFPPTGYCYTHYKIFPEYSGIYT